MKAKAKRIPFYVSDTKHKELKIFCAKLGISMNKFIDNAVQEKINRKLKKMTEVNSNI